MEEGSNGVGPPSGDAPWSTHSTPSWHRFGSEIGRLQAFMVARLVVATLLLGGLLFLMIEGDHGLDAFSPQFLIALIATLYGLTLLAALWVQMGKARSSVAPVQLVGDLLITTGLIYVTGGSNSGFTFLYGVAVLMAALVVGPRAARFTGIGAICLYSALTLLLWTQALPPPADQPVDAYTLSNIETAYSASLPLAGLVLVTVLASNLATRLHVAGGRLRRAEASAYSLAQLNDDIVRSISSGLLTTDENGHIRTINDFGALTFGATQQELKGKPAEFLLPGVESHINQAVEKRQGRIARAECAAQRPAGGRFPAGFSVTPLLNPAGEATGALIVFQDLTEIKQLRLAAARQERLAMLGQLSAGLAHEIRNPLSSISGSVQLVRDSAALSEEDRKLLGIVLDEADRLNELVNTMLQIGRPRDPQKLVTDLRDIVRDVAQVAERGPLRDTGIDLVVKLPQEAVMAEVDAGQVRQVVWNLLKNAIQASPSHATVTVCADHGAAMRPRLWVSDEGDGLDAAQQNKVYEMFHSERTHGTGIGLALVRQIVDAHEATIAIESGSGQGAKFLVEFPQPSITD